MKQDTLILVLGKGNNSDGSISEETKSSVEKAVGLFKEGKAGTMLMSGGWSFMLEKKPADTEANGMKKYAVSLGVPSDSILKEERSLDTTGNALYSIDIIAGLPEIKRIILVTVDYHMPRARYMFEKAFGGSYEMEFVESRSGLSSEKLEKKRESEARMIELMNLIYGSVAHEDFKKIVLRTHPLYGKDPSTIPELVWKSFDSAGITREYLISKYMAPKEKVTK